MTEAQRAHERLMQSLPVRTHYRNEPAEINPYTGKPAISPLARKAIHLRQMPARENTFIPKSPTKPKMPRWSKPRGSF